ncbi:MAG TPA: hypothetical protein PKE03_05965 [Bacteroidales bacterium]|mgnify:CR=1 FL=1|nr:hypothetical protein [Bacteroidales bacterium]
MKRNHNNQIFCIAIIVSLFIFQSCDKEITSVRPAQSNETKTKSVYQKKLKNPYTVENMQEALNNLLDGQGAYEITPSHYYVKFVPYDDDELSLLKNDTSIYLYQYPLDVELEEGSLTYQDPEVPIGQPTYQYTSVPVDYAFPDVAFEILAELFIPESSEEVKEELPVPVEKLVYEALRITDNLGDDKTAKSGPWTPAGTMRVWDDTLNTFVPIVGLEVRARRWFTTYKGTTNENGYYICNGTFDREANYSLQFERYDFEIRDGWLSTANINGPKKKGQWSLDMGSGKEKFWATIFRATHHYYYQNIQGLRRPPQNSFWNTQLKLRAVYETNSSNGTHCASCRFLGLGSAIKIYNPQNSSMQIYGTTIHEIAHASHWKMDPATYNCQYDSDCWINCCTGDLKVSESWARGVQWVLTGMVYPPNSMGNYPTYNFGNYTGVVQDMIDGIEGYDQVTGYTIRQIEDALIGQLTWNAWRDNIKNLYNNATENNLDALFAYWN